MILARLFKAGVAGGNQILVALATIEDDSIVADATRSFRFHVPGLERPG